MKNATKTVGEILRDNICTVFNLLNLMIAVALAAAGEWKNILFFLVIVVNTVIGIVQELRAKHRTEQLTLLSQPYVTVLRGHSKLDIAAASVRAGDLMQLGAGAAVCTDGVLTEGTVEVSEAILTGESESVVKHVGDRLLSGSSIISGRCVAEASCTPDESYGARLTEEVKRTSGGESELLSSMKKVTRLTGFFILPLGVLMLLQAILVRGESFDTAIVAASAGLLGMLPKGLVLLISIGLAVGVVRLSKKNVLVRDLHSLENLAHCDTVCLDKTGTLTCGSLRVSRVICETDKRELDRLMATYIENTEDNNQTFEAMRAYFIGGVPYSATGAVPFSSARKCSSVILSDGRALVLGAPEVLCGEISEELRGLMSQGERVLLVGTVPLTDGDTAALRDASAIRKSFDMLAAIVISDELRANAAETVRYFYDQGVAVKVISGDSALAAAAVARRCGIHGAERMIDTLGLDDAQLEAAAREYTVFGRVTPEQKKKLIAAMQRDGHRVAMTGDGVNDLLAMRQADCSAAMGSGSDAAKQIAQLVLLDSDFSVLRDVLSEGRRVVNNLTRSAGVFFIKTIYSVLLCLLCLATNTDFPFIPIQITLIDAVIEAFPAFIMSFEPNDRRVRGSFLRSAVGAALPFGLAVFACCLVLPPIASRLGLGAAQLSLIRFLCVGFISLGAVLRASMPPTPFHVFLCAASVLGFICAVALFSPLLGLPALASGSRILIPFAVLPGIVLSTISGIRLPERSAADGIFARGRKGVRRNDA